MDIPVEKRARKSMVVVRDANGEYCSGCVLKSKGKYTYVLTQSSFASGREDTLKICFFDQIEREASAFASGDTFCLLRTKRHTDCRPIKKMRGQVMPEPMVVFAPSSATSAYHIPGFVISESTAALDLRRNHINGSECYFLGTCHYAEKGFNGHCRLVGSPVFSLKGKVMGLIAGTCVKELNLYLGGYEIKVALLTSHMDGMLNAMLPKSDAAKKKIASRKKGGKFP